MMFRLMTYNIRHGGRGREAQIADVINACAPDLVLQEATDPRSVERLAAATGMEEWRAYAGQSLGFLSRTRVALAEWTRPRVSRHAFVEVVPAGAALRAPRYARAVAPRSLSPLLASEIPSTWAPPHSH
jgi:exodeoxyribonuclease III